jgi:hypothetical protein
MYSRIVFMTTMNTSAFEVTLAARSLEVLLDSK